MFKFSVFNIERLNFSFVFIRNNSNKKLVENDDVLAKRILCGKIDPLYLFPDFEFESRRDFQKKSRVILRVMRCLIDEFPCKDESEVVYLAENFGINTVCNNEDFYDELLKKELDLCCDTSLFNLGLRSISAVLSWNIKKISLNRINQVVADLKPIVVNLKRKELLFN